MIHMLQQCRVPPGIVMIMCRMDYNVADVLGVVESCSCRSACPPADKDADDKRTC
jgi:hypothetical protein